MLAAISFSNAASSAPQPMDRAARNDAPSRTERNDDDASRSSTPQYRKRSSRDFDDVLALMLNGGTLQQQPILIDATIPAAVSGSGNSTTTGEAQATEQADLAFGATAGTAEKTIPKDSTIQNGDASSSKVLNAIGTGIAQHDKGDSALTATQSLSVDMSGSGDSALLNGQDTAVRVSVLSQSGQKLAGKSLEQAWMDSLERIAQAKGLAGSDPTTADSTDEESAMTSATSSTSSGISGTALGATLRSTSLLPEIIGNLNEADDARSAVSEFTVNATALNSSFMFALDNAEPVSNLAKDRLSADSDSLASGNSSRQINSETQLASATSSDAASSGLVQSGSVDGLPNLAASISSEMRQPLTSQVSQAIMDHVERNGVRQNESLSVRLDPPELGEMTIEISKTHEGLAVRVTARESVTMDMLLVRGQEIEAQLRDQHMNLKSLEFQRSDMSNSGFSHGQGQPQQQNNSSRRSENLLNQVRNGARGISPISSTPRSATSESAYGLSFRA